MRAWALPEPATRRVACQVSSIKTPETSALPSEVVVIPRGEGLHGPHLYLANDDELSSFCRALADPGEMGILVLRDLLIPCSLVDETPRPYEHTDGSCNHPSWDTSGTCLHCGYNAGDYADDDPLDLRCSDCGAEPWEYCSPGCAR